MKYLTMKGLIFAEGNGYGHVSRDKGISDRFDIPIMTFGKGAEYLKMREADFIEIPSPYNIETANGKTKVIANVAQLLKYLSPSVTIKILQKFKMVDFVIVDGSPAGLILAKLAGKKSVLITNDTSSLVGFTGIQKRMAGQLNNILLGYPERILVPDYPPPLTVAKYNLLKQNNIDMIGPLIEKAKQVRHNKEVLVITTDTEITDKIRAGLGDSALYSSDIGDVKPYYESSKVVITHGGHTTITEALSYGKPVIAVTDYSYPERRNHIQFIEEANVGFGVERQLFKEEYLETMIRSARLLDRNKLKLYKRTARKAHPENEIEQVIAKL